jgi:hypothetical protein
MNTLFDNAVQSIQLGVEDYQANDPRRAMSAVRSFLLWYFAISKRSARETGSKRNARRCLGCTI